MDYEVGQPVDLEINRNDWNSYRVIGTVERIQDFSDQVHLTVRQPNGTVCVVVALKMSALK